MDSNKNIPKALEHLVKAVFCLANSFEALGADLTDFYKSIEDSSETSPPQSGKVSKVSESETLSGVDETSDKLPTTKVRRKRRTKKEMEELRAKEVSSNTEKTTPPKGVDGNIKSDTDFSDDSLDDSGDLGDLDDIGSEDETAEDDFNDIEGLEDTFKETKSETAGVSSPSSKDSEDDDLTDLGLFD